jgi:hypothetical protein
MEATQNKIHNVKRGYQAVVVTNTMLKPKETGCGKRRGGKGNSMSIPKMTPSAVLVRFPSSHLQSKNRKWVTR